MLGIVLNSARRSSEPPISNWSVWHSPLGLINGFTNKYGIVDSLGSIQKVTDPSQRTSFYSEQLTGSVQPLLSNNLFGSKKGFGFGSNRFFDVSDLSLTNGISSITLYTVAKVTSGGAARILFFTSTGTNASNARFQISSGATNVWTIAGRRADGDGAATLTGGSTLTDKVLAFVVDFANSNAYIYENKVLVASSTSFLTDGNVSSTNSLASFFGKNNGGNAFAGNVGDLLIYKNQAHNTGQLNQMSDWLNYIQGYRAY